MLTIKTDSEVKLMKEGGKRLAAVINELRTRARSGVTTKELDELSLKLIKKSGAEPAFLNYRPAGAKKAYPATLCASVNDVVVHGLPSDYILKDGDLLKIDLGLKYEKFYVDSAITVGIGQITSLAEKLIQVTETALSEAINRCLIGNTLGDLGHAIESYAKSNHFSVIKGLTGHGIGRNLHEDPNVLNYGQPGEGEEIVEGMVLAIEPMLSASKSIKGSGVRDMADDSFATIDGSLSAHFEHTVSVTKKGPEILTVN